MITSKKISPKQCVKKAKTQVFSDPCDVLYKTTIIPNKENLKTKIDFGVSEAALKLRYANHQKPLNNIKCETDTVISNEYWNIKSANKTSNRSYDILETHKSKRFFLCLNGKLAIVLHKNDNMLSQR